MDAVDEFIQLGIENVFPGQWEVIGGGFGTRIEVDNVGVLVIHSDRFIHFASGLLSGLDFSEELVRRVSTMNCGGPFGSLVLSEGQPGHWMLAYGFKMVKTWFDPSSRAAPQLILDILNFIPGYVNNQTQEIQAEFGGEKWGVDASWWFVLMDHY
ncbi:MAG: hypothetical protein QOJ73_4262 [Streptosporangiaceae bacterium]|jgi:hypothetical protein|nr:hypothetical protein [Streptosporangiaceae bacterium]